MMTVATSDKRSDALDALRGLAILLMILSGTIHTDPPLPAWMFHAQVGPPSFTFDPNHPGITWVDLVFPFFLFAMGMAIPFSLSKKIERGVPMWKIVLEVLQRGVLLAGFAIALQHLKPFALHADPSATDWLVGLLGFVFLFAALLRLPASWKLWQRVSVRTAGYGGIAILLSQLVYGDGSGFLLTRSDIIIVVLANVSVFGSLLWLMTRTQPMLRLGILGILIAFRLTQGVEGSWNQWLWSATPIPWLYRFSYLQYLFIVLPGTVIGDLVYTWTTSREEAAAGPATSSASGAAMLGALMIAAVVVNLAGLFTRALVATAAADAALCAAAITLAAKPLDALGRLHRTLVQWGSYWLLLGVCFEAFEGGIKKDHPTMSYYFVTTGLAIFTYVAFSLVADRFQRTRAIRLLSENGQNPMIAYVGASNLILPLLALTSAAALLEPLVRSPWTGFVRGLIITLLVACATRMFTRYRLFWRT